MKTLLKASCSNNMGLAIFENYSQTKEGTNYAPFIVHTLVPKCFDLVNQWMKENNYTDIQPNKDYWEIFGKKDEFEITITISNEEQGSLVNISVFGKTGKTRKKLKEIIKSLIEFIQ